MEALQHFFKRTHVLQLRPLLVLLPKNKISGPQYNTFNDNDSS